jgi:hypothetical protein
VTVIVYVVEDATIGIVFQSNLLFIVSNEIGFVVGVCTYVYENTGLGAQTVVEKSGKA